MWDTLNMTAPRDDASGAKPGAKFDRKTMAAGAAVRPVSLAALAAHLKLSTAAVSRVLNQVPAARSIPAVTQERIFAAARSLNYRPNVLARSLRRGLSMTVGVLVPEISEGYTTLVLAGLEQGLRRAGYTFFLCSHHHQQEALEAARVMLIERAVDGVIAIDSLFECSAPLPMVTVSCPPCSSGVANIVLNHYSAARLALEHLVSFGHRRIAVMKGQLVSSDTATRWEAISQTADQLGIAIKPRYQIELTEDMPGHEPGYLATRRLLSAVDDFTAIFAFNDISAIGAIRALHEANLRVPEDVSVVGFDDIQSAAFQNPALTTVRQPLRHMGLLASETILAYFNSPGGTESATIEVEPELVIRESTARVRKSVRMAARQNR
jgi:DNA-binding LacI/PurR family transcriptional regulator